MKIALLFIIQYYIMDLDPLYKKFEAFSYKSLEDLKRKLNQLEIKIPITKEVGILKKSIVKYNLVIPNRLAVQPMEGFDAHTDGSPSELTLRRYERYANGGAGVIWFEATSISEKCRSNSHQLMITEDNINEFQMLVKSTRERCNNTLKKLGVEDQCKLIIQLNHSGRYSKLNGDKYPIRAYHNKELDDAIQVSQEKGMMISDKEIELIEDLWVKKAILARKAGFDGVDIKACHGYLISELLSARTRKNSKYGGNSLDNRARLLLNIISKLNSKVKNDNDFLITSRLGIYDGIPYPFGFGIDKDEKQTFPAEIDLYEPISIINKLYKFGIRLINISAGNPHYISHITRPYDIPIKNGQFPKEHPLFSACRITNLISEIKRRIPEDIIIIGSGYSYFRQFAGCVAAGLIQNNNVDICGFGRMSIANPEFPKQLFQNGIIDKNKVCITCSKCSALMRQGEATGCVIRDPLYKNKI
jgi:2,4-dienoyl-CoA reductase-like NADH-dependent reductase (Old Yellow Enzyme family)